MNILYYCDEYPPYQNGGIGTATKLVAESLVTRGHRVFVVGKYPDKNRQDTINTNQKNGVTIIRINSANHNRWYKRCMDILLYLFTRLALGKIASYIRYLKAKKEYRMVEKYLLHIIRENNIELIEMPDYVDDFLSGLDRPFRFQKYHIPLVIRVHGSTSFLAYHIYEKRDEILLSMDKAHFERADAVCAVSEFSKQFVIQHIETKKSVEVIYNPIENSLFASTVSHENTQTILFFGKIVETKGAFSLIRAFNEVGKMHPDVRLKLLGNGDIDKAKAMVDSSLLERVNFGGFVTHEEIIEAIDTALFCVLPSYFENFSMAALEVLARKRALIYTTRSSGKELITDGVNGLLVEPTDIPAIAKKMHQLLTDEKRRTILAEKGYESTQSRFSTYTIIPQLEKYYTQIIKDYAVKQG